MTTKDKVGSPRAGELADGGTTAAGREHESRISGTRLRAAQPATRVLVVAVTEETAAGLASEFLRSLPSDSRTATLLVLPASLAREPSVLGAFRGASSIDVSNALLPGRKVIASIDDRPIVVRGRVFSGAETRHPLDRLFRSIDDRSALPAIAVLFGAPQGDGWLGLRSLKDAGGLAFGWATESAWPGELEQAFEHTTVDGLDPTLARTSLDENASAPTLEEVVADLTGTLDPELERYDHVWLTSRVRRRMLRAGHDTVAAYRHTIDDLPGERLRLRQDLAQRDARFLGAPNERLMLRSVLDDLRIGAHSIRCWVPACATGEEAYSLAIASHEADAHPRAELSVFATDLPGPSLTLARHGLFGTGIEVDVGANDLRSYFRKEGALYRIAPSVRSHVMFAEHDVLRDHSFSRIDLVLCRRLLSRLGADARRSVLHRLHWALKAGGYLIVDGVEHDDLVRELFDPTEDGEGVYRRRELSRRRTRSTSEVGLRLEVDHTRETDRLEAMLRSALEANRIIDEQLRTAHEELAVADEQLRMCAEELDAARTEARARNEELAHVNARLLEKIHALSRANDDLTNLLSSTKLAAMFLDAAGRITRFTPAMSEIFDLDEVHPGATIASFEFRAETIGIEEDVRRVLESSSAIERELPVRGERMVLMRLLPYVTVDGAVEGVVATFTDVTDQRRIAERLRAQASLAQLGEMAAVISHEVRNALAGIGGAAEIIGRRLPVHAPERSAIDEIRSRIGSLDQTVTDLLRFARPETPVLAPGSIRVILEQVRAVVRADPLAANVDLRIEGDEVEMCVDAGLLRSALSNLVLNAAHAMNGRGTIVCRVRSEGGRCHIEVIDQGPGVPCELHAKIFEPFFSTKRRGTGLGLAIVKRVAEAHGGSVTVDDAPSGGAILGLVLPMTSTQRKA